MGEGRVPVTRPGPPEDRLTRKKSPVLIISTTSGGTPDPNPGSAGTAKCPRCGHDPLIALRQLLGERHEAWLGGRLEGFEHGWRDGLIAGAERRTAA